jgi:hypothetical protein
MPKPASADLFYLIRSLTKSEKGYIKKFAFRYEEANFIKLFNAIEKQDEYDEQKILKNESYIKQLPRLKFYLYQRILDSLDDYYSARDINMQLRRILNRVSILFEKGYYDQCIKQLYKAKELAVKFEKFSQQLEILEWERTLMIEEQFVQNFERISKEETEVLEKIKNLSLYNYAYSEMNKLYAELIYIRNRREDERMKKIISTDIFKNENRAKSFQAKILYYKTVDKYYSANNDRKKYMQYSGKVLDLVEKQPGYIENNIMQYIKLLNNHITILSENKQYDQFEIQLGKLRNLPRVYSEADSSKFKNLILIRVTIREFYHAINIKDFKSVMELAKKMEKILNSHPNLVSATHRTIFFYQIAYMYFIEDNLKQSLMLTNRIINSTVTTDKLFFQCFARLLNLVIHFEMENFDLLPYLVKSNIAFFSKHHKMYSLEKIIFNFFGRIEFETVAIENQSRKLFSELKKTLTRNLDPLEYKVLEYFDFMKWTESKMENKSFREVLAQAKE